MADTLHPLASRHLPAFITAPGDTDALMVVTAVILLGSVVAFGVLFLTLHTLPERIAHKSHKLQFEIVAVLGLIALFTHMHVFWVAGLLLALIDIPDIGGWLGRIANSVDRIAGNGPHHRSADKVQVIEPGRSRHAGANSNKNAITVTEPGKFRVVALGLVVQARWLLQALSVRARPFLMRVKVRVFSDSDLVVEARRRMQALILRVQPLLLRFKARPPADR